MCTDLEEYWDWVGDITDEWFAHPIFKEWMSNIHFHKRYGDKFYIVWQLIKCYCEHLSGEQMVDPHKLDMNSFMTYIDTDYKGEYKGEYIV
jgi:hypothetical protein